MTYAVNLGDITCLRMLLTISRELLAVTAVNCNLKSCLPVKKPGEFLFKAVTEAVGAKFADMLTV